jgi:hypothetical protein
MAHRVADLCVGRVSLPDVENRQLPVDRTPGIAEITRAPIGRRARAAYAGEVTPRRLLEPSRLAPVAVDLRRVFVVGTALWALALVVSAVLVGAGVVDGRQVWVSGAGVALGFLALAWERRRRARTTAAAG